MYVLCFIYLAEGERVLWTILGAIAAAVDAIIALIRLVYDSHKNKKQDSDPPDQG